MTLGDFLLDLGTNQESLIAFSSDQRAFIEGSDLDESQKAMLLAGDVSLRKLHIKINVEIVVGGEELEIIVICMPVICVPDPTDPDTTNPKD